MKRLDMETPLILITLKIWDIQGRMFNFRTSIHKVFRICPGAFKSLSVDSLLVEWGRLVGEDLATTAVRALERYHLSGVMPVVQRASSQWHDLTSTNFLLLATSPRQWQQAWDAKVPKIDGRVSNACPEVTLYRSNIVTEGSLAQHANGSRDVVFSDSVSCLSGLDHDGKVRYLEHNLSLGAWLDTQASQAMRLPTFKQN